MIIYDSLTFIFDLPYKVNPASENLPRIISVNEPFQIRELCGDAESARHHENGLVLLHGNTTKPEVVLWASFLHGATDAGLDHRGVR